MCSHCQNQVTQTFNKVNGVETVNVDLEKATAHIEFNENKTNEADLKLALKETTYTIV